MYESIYENEFLCDKHLAAYLEILEPIRFVAIHAQPGLAFCSECVKSDESLRTNLVPDLYRVNVS